jgi:hypothetical protein
MIKITVERDWEGLDFKMEISKPKWLMEMELLPVKTKIFYHKSMIRFLTFEQFMFKEITSVFLLGKYLMFGLPPQIKKK